jgi:hypothetical protein
MLKRAERYDDDSDDELDEESNVLSPNNTRINLNKLIADVLKQNDFVGTDDTFHNLAVDLASHEDYRNVCDFIEKGLLMYPYSIDLLGDYIKYCISGGRKEKGKKYFEQLIAIEKNKWHERAFQFSYEFIEGLYKISADESLVSELSDLIDKYQKNFPASDNAFALEYDFCKKYGTPKEKGEIKDKIEELVDNGTLKRVAMCSIKLAEYYFNEKLYDRCKENLDRCEKDNIQLHPRLKNTYLHTLFILCETAMLFEEVPVCLLSSIRGTDKESIIKEIYNRANIIKELEDKYGNGRWYKEIEPIIIELSKFTHIPYYYENTNDD